MSFTDLSNVAAQYPQARPQLTPQQQQDLAAQAPPDPRSFQPLPPTNPASRAFQQASGIPGVDPTERDPNEAAALENTGAAKKPDDTPETTYPPVPFEPSVYSRPQPDRGADKWGQAVPAIELAGLYNQVAVDPDLPSPRESYDEIRDAGAYLNKFGAPAYGDPAGQASFLANPLAAILDAFSHGKFSQNYTAAAMRGIYIRQAQMLEHNQQAWMAHQQFLLGIAPIFNRISSGDPQSVLQAERDLRDYLIQSNHQYLLGRLNNHDIRGIAQALNEEDAQMRRMMAAGSQLGKVVDSQKDQRELDALGGRVSPGGIGGLFDPNKLPGRESPEGPVTPASEQGGQESGDYASPHDQQIGENLIRQGVDRDTARGILAQAHKALNGMPGDYDLTKGGLASRLIGQATQALGNRIDKVSNFQDPNIDPEELSRQKQAEINRIDPDQGALIQGLKDLRIDPNSAEMAHGMRRHLVTLTAKIYPNWNEGSYRQFQTVWNKGDSRENLQIDAGNRAATSLVTYQAAVNRLKIPEDSTIPANVWNEWKTNGYTSDPQFAALNEPLRTLATEFVFLSGGRSQVTAVQQFLREAPLYGGKAQLRTIARQGSIQAMHIMEQKIGQFQKQTGMTGLPPALDQDAMTIFGDFARSNPNTGVFPNDATPELKSIEPSAEQRARMPQWLKTNPSQQFEPMTKDQWEGLRATIEDLRKNHPNDPRLPALLHEFGIRQ